MPAKTAPSKAATPNSAKESASVRRRLSWILLVGVVPVLVGVVIIGGALQFVGVPVWQTTMQVMGLSKTGAQNSAMTAEKTQVQSLDAQVKALTADKTKLTQMNQSLTAKQQTMQKQVSALQKQLQVQTSDMAAGQQEGRVLAQMDATAAASVLQKMGVSEAGWVVASMSPDASGPILQAVPAAFASSVMQQAAADAQVAQQVQNSTNQTSNNTTSAGNAP